IRAGGNLNVYGSVSDGFGAAPFAGSDGQNTPQVAWILVKGTQAYGDVVIPRAVGLIEQNTNGPRAGRDCDSRSDRAR
ncbi:hypothetical protein KC218_28605, partial [Mycobacterium tuberculosis]|nr:hypothetical protein [Mycobacterium tuberculosis]